MNLHIFICRLETALYLTVWAAQYVDFIVLAGIIASEAAAHQPITHPIPSHPIPSNPISTRLFSSQTGFGPWPETDRAGISGWIYVYIYKDIYWDWDLAIVWLLLIWFWLIGMANWQFAALAARNN